MKNGRYVKPDGTIEWYKDDLLHREDGPAIEWKDGDKYWYKNGLKHREDGPAVLFPNGNGWYYLNDVSYSEENFKKYLLGKKLDKELELKEKFKRPKI